MRYPVYIGITSTSPLRDAIKHLKTVFKYVRETQKYIYLSDTSKQDFMRLDRTGFVYENAKVMFNGKVL